MAAAYAFLCVVFGLLGACWGWAMFGVWGAVLGGYGSGAASGVGVALFRVALVKYFERKKDTRAELQAVKAR